jgi:HSP20 family protein
MTRAKGSSLLPHEWQELSLFPFLEPVIRIEDYLEDDRYVVRAELPGIDPATDLKVTYADGALHLTMTRTEERKEKGRSEFRYGTFHRTVQLPLGARENTIKARYDHGILEITVDVGEPTEIGKSIPIAISNGQPKPKKS